MTKQCKHCGEVKPLLSFSQAKRGTQGVAAYCKPCFAAKYRDKDKARERSARYRAKHPERWKAAHRLHQFKRRSQIAATSDGTVTDDFLVALYQREVCYWCNKYTEEAKRTLEHVIELCAGGPHSIHNIEMACLSCNSARLGRSNADSSKDYCA